MNSSINSSNNNHKISNKYSETNESTSKLNAETTSQVIVNDAACISLDGDDNEQSLDVNQRQPQSKDNIVQTNCNQIIHLNVGGIKYVTSLGTLQNFAAQGHFFSAMFSGKFSTVPTINNNEYFIDRDGECFKYILGFLRNGPQYIENVLMMLSRDQIKMIQHEAEYFNLYPIIFDSFFFTKWTPGFFSFSEALSKEFQVYNGDHPVETQLELDVHNPRSSMTQTIDFGKQSFSIQHFDENGDCQPYGKAHETFNFPNHHYLYQLRIGVWALFTTSNDVHVKVV